MSPSLSIAELVLVLLISSAAEAEATMRSKLDEVTIGKVVAIEIIFSKDRRLSSPRFSMR